MQGMDAMMQTLREENYNVEFNIVFVSSPVEERLLKAARHMFGVKNVRKSDLSRYRDLALATGGDFLHLEQYGSSPERTHFLHRVDVKSSSSNEGKQLEARQQYEARLSKGNATRFEWYRQLAAPRN